MNRAKAEKKIRRKIARTKPCPFCGRIPKIEATCDISYSKHGSWGHYAKRHSCCKPTGLGQTELFYCNTWDKPNYGLWWRMLNRLVDDWNHRVTPV